MNSLPIFYWKKLCNIRAFDLIKKKYRLLAVVFWLLILTTLSILVYISTIFIIEKREYENNKLIIDEYEGNFALNRFFESYGEDVRLLNIQLTSETGIINSNLKNEHVPVGFNRSEIHNLINKLSTSIRFIRSENTEYNDRELQLFDSLANKIGYKEYTYMPKSGLFNNTDVLHNFSMTIYNNAVVYNSELEDKLRSLYLRRFQVARASLAHSNAHDGNLSCCFYTWGNSDTTRFYDFIGWNSLSLKNAQNISNALPNEFSIDYFDEKYNSNNYNQNGGRYFPSFLVEPFAKLSFYDPAGFDPFKLINNLKRAKIGIGTFDEILIRFLISISIITGVNIFIVILIRVIYWINEG